MVYFKKTSNKKIGKNFAKSDSNNFSKSFRNKEGDRSNLRSNNGEPRNNERRSFRSESRPSANKRPSWELPQFEGQKKFFKKPWGSSKLYSKDRSEREENSSQDFRDSSRPSWRDRKPYNKNRQDREGSNNMEFGRRERPFEKNRNSNNESFSRDFPRKEKSDRRGSFSNSDSKFRGNLSTNFNSKSRYKENVEEKNFIKPVAKPSIKGEFKKEQQENKASILPFHLAIPVNDLEETRKFYSQTLGLLEGRSNERWIDWNLFGHQVVTHLRPSKIDSRSQEIVNQVDDHGVPVPHFGVVLKWQQFQDFSKKLQEAGVQFVIEPYIRFQGEIGEQATMFFYDPSGNALEFKSFKDISQLFRKYE